VAATNSSSEAIRMGMGITTMVAPASHTAAMAVTRSRLVGPRRATWSPGCTPRACRMAAMPWASSTSRFHSTRSGSSPFMNVMAPPRPADDSIRDARLSMGTVTSSAAERLQVDATRRDRC
jgi:hypothetical protein